GGACAQTSLTRTSSFAYSPTTGLLTQEVVEPNDATLKLQTDYGYDGFGNKTSTAVSGVGITTRTSSASYSGDGRFQTGATNALPQSKSCQYDARFGNPTSHTGPNGLTTTWQYDSFGRKTLEVRPDLTRTTWAYAVCTPGACGPGASYYVVQTPLDANGAQ